MTHTPQSDAPPFAKDCGCATHKGPHWLHMQLMDRIALKRRVAEYDASPRKTPGFEAWAHGEAARLEGELADEMQRRGIDVLPAAIVNRVRESHERWVREQVAARATERVARRERAERRLTEIAAEYETTTTQRRREIETETAELQRELCNV